MDQSLPNHLLGDNLNSGASANSPSREYIYGGSALLAKIDSTGTKYYHQDHLSNRLVTDSNGNTYAQLGHYPFGEKWYNTTNDKFQFTSYERDAESGNDYVQARTHINRLSRFSSADPVPGSTGDPQTWNRYAYVANNPVSFVDPKGTNLRGPGNTCIGDTAGIVCDGGGGGSGGIGGGGGGGFTGGGGGVNSE